MFVGPLVHLRIFLWSAIVNIRWLAFSMLMLLGCTHGLELTHQDERPRKTDTKFDNLPILISGIREHGELLLYEGLPHDFWEAELLQSELRRKKTLRLYGYPFYEELLSLEKEDAEKLTTLFSDEKNFSRYRGAKECGGYHPDYCAEWKTAEGPISALICLGCDEVKMYGPQCELHCDFPEAGALSQLFTVYRKNRPPRKVNE